MPSFSAPRLANRHYFQQVAVRILEVEASPAPAGIDLAVGVVVWPAAVSESLGLHPTENRLELRLTDMEGIVMALAGPGVETRPAPCFGLIGEVKGQALIDLHLREVALPRLDLQSEDLGEEFGRGDLVFRRHDSVIENNCHGYLLCLEPLVLAVTVLRPLENNACHVGYRSTVHQSLHSLRPLRHC